MNLDSCVPLKDQKERQTPFSEVINAEKQLWPLIHSKGLLHTEVQELYRRARFGYEKTILNDDKEVELQDVEYSLWKLHYKHIDEFRKRIRQTPQNGANGQSSSIDCHMEQFKLFLSEATEFYQELITKLRRFNGLPDQDPLFYEKGGDDCAVDPIKLHKCQYLCHRFLVCLGDLARYRELYKNLDFQRHDWSVAATFYFKATLVWPDSGNPQNQLALLATYDGDDFLALYHCIRSLAIKEPFPDARDNLILLFEKNQSSHLHSLSREDHFNFLNPSERSTSLIRSQSSGGSLDNDFAKNDLWPLFLRMISFFFIESSLEEFPSTFASTLRELDSLLALDDTKLKATMESYQHMDSTRKGPYRALQMVSVLIFIIDSLTECFEHRDSKENKNMQQPRLIQWALTATFIFLGCLVKRCLKGNYLELSPLLPAVLVFVEWLVGMPDKVETYGAGEKVGSAISYFVDAFVDLLNQLDKNEDEFKSQGHTALWEDYELRGFAPVAHAHGSLAFTDNSKFMGNFDSVNACRAYRIFRAGMKIVDRSDGSQKWITYDYVGRKFYKTESKEFPDCREAEVAESGSCPEVKELHQHREGGVAVSSSGPEVKEAHQHKHGAIGENEKLHENGKSVAIEEEEVILFKPITRHNSVPLYSSNKDDEMPMKGMKDQSAPSDETLRRATSLFLAQNPSQIDPFSFHSDAGNVRSNKLFKPQEPLLKDTPLYPAGPPSLSAWVLENEKGTRDFFKPHLSPIDEIASASLIGLSLSDSGHVSATAPYSPHPFSTPVPSAPFLPEDALWFSGNSASFSEGKSLGSFKDQTDGILGAPPMSSYANWSAIHGPFNSSPSIPSFEDGYQPVLGMSSSEWLHHYANQNLDRASSQVWPVHLCAPGGPGNLYGHDTSRFELCDPWGNPLTSNRIVYFENPQHHLGSPLIYGVEEQRREKLFHGYQRPSPYGCGAVTELRAEQPPLLQYLKEKEWQLQRQSQVRGPTHMGT